jgi:hypothetical protein
MIEVYNKCIKYMLKYVNYPDEVKLEESILYTPSLDKPRKMLRDINEESKGVHQKVGQHAKKQRTVGITRQHRESKHRESSIHKETETSKAHRNTTARRR